MGLDDSNFLTFPFFQTKKCIKLLQVKLTLIPVYLKVSCFIYKSNKTDSQMNLGNK